MKKDLPISNAAAAYSGTLIYSLEFLDIIQVYFTLFFSLDET